MEFWETGEKGLLISTRGCLSACVRDDARSSCSWRASQTPRVRVDSGAVRSRGRRTNERGWGRRNGRPVWLSLDRSLSPRARKYVRRDVTEDVTGAAGTRLRRHVSPWQHMLDASSLALPLAIGAGAGGSSANPTGRNSSHSNPCLWPAAANHPMTG